jgi:hypothetical protein
VSAHGDEHERPFGVRRGSGGDLDGQPDLKIDGVNPQIVAPRLDNNAPAVGAVGRERRCSGRQAVDPGSVPGLWPDEQGNPVPTRECSVWIEVPEVGQPELAVRPDHERDQRNDDMTIGTDETLRRLRRRGIDSRRLHGVHGDGAGA